MIELELQLLVGGNGHPVDFPKGRLCCPEGDNIVELASHGRDEAGFIIGTVGQQGIGEALLVDLVIEDVARIQVTDLHHDLAGAPVDHACRGRVVELEVDVEIMHVAIGLVDGHPIELRVGGQRVVVVFEDAIILGALPVHDFDYPMDDERSGAVLLDGDIGTVEQAHAVEARVFFWCRQGQVGRYGGAFPDLLGLNKCSRRTNKREADQFPSFHLLDFEV